MRPQAEDVVVIVVCPDGDKFMCFYTSDESIYDLKQRIVSNFNILYPWKRSVTVTTLGVKKFINECEIDIPDYFFARSIFHSMNEVYLRLFHAKPNGRSIVNNEEIQVVNLKEQVENRKLDSASIDSALVYEEAQNENCKGRKRSLSETNQDTKHKKKKELCIETIEASDIPETIPRDELVEPAEYVEIKNRNSSLKANSNFKIKDSKIKENEERSNIEQTISSENGCDDSSDNSELKIELSMKIKENINRDKNNIQDNYDIQENNNSQDNDNSDHKIIQQCSKVYHDTSSQKKLTNSTICSSNVDLNFPEEDNWNHELQEDEIEKNDTSVLEGRKNSSGDESTKKIEGKDQVKKTKKSVEKDISSSDDSCNTLDNKISNEKSNMNKIATKQKKLETDEELGRSSGNKLVRRFSSDDDSSSSDTSSEEEQNYSQSALSSLIGLSQETHLTGKSNSCYLPKVPSSSKMKKRLIYSKNTAAATAFSSSKYEHLYQKPNKFK